MKKRMFAALLSIALLLSLAPSGFALGGFSDVTDQETARNVEVLRLMGVVSGNGDGTYRPNSNLTRAEFCKMAVVLQGRGEQNVRYRSRTVFPDVRATHWASGYINLATMASDDKTPGLMHGFPDGTFQPDRPITYGEAITVLMRAMGYTDKDSGGVWPQGYLDLAAATGVSGGLNLTGGAAITRAQAAKLFVNVLNSDTKDSTKIYAESIGTVSSETTLRSVDYANAKLKTTDGKEYDLDKVLAGSGLVGLKGRVVTKGDKVLTFLPSISSTGTTLSDAAVIVRADGSTEGFDALTGGVTDYGIYRNGVSVSRTALKRYDVATYNPATNAVQVTDTRVNVWYESCEPSPSAPNTITILGTKFSVLPTAQQSLSAYKPGQAMVVFLTADGRVAGAAAKDANISGNAYAYVNGDGKVSLICGGSLIALSCDAPGNSAGKVGRISQSKVGASAPKVYVSAQSDTARGMLDVNTGTIGSTRVAENALVIYNGKLIALSEIEERSIASERITYTRTNSNNQVDVLVISDATVRDEIYGRLDIREGAKTQEWVPNPGHENDEDWVDGVNGHYETVRGARYITVDCGANGKTGEHEVGYAYDNGTVVAAKYKKNGPPYFEYMEPLTKLAKVPASAWIGDTAVVVNGRTYTIPETVICWNLDTKAWFADYDTAMDYGGTRDLYVKDGVVRVIEIRA